MVPTHTESISVQDWTCAITSLERDRAGLRFRVEYGAGPDYRGTLFTATTLSGVEREHETHQEDPEISFGWPSTSLRDAVMPRVREMALIYCALRTEGRRNG